MTGVREEQVQKERREAGDASQKRRCVEGTASRLRRSSGREHLQVRYDEALGLVPSVKTKQNKAIHGFDAPAFTKTEAAYRYESKFSRKSLSCVRV